MNVFVCLSVLVGPTYQKSAFVCKSAFIDVQRPYASALTKHSPRFCLLPANPKDNFMLTSLTGLMEASIFLPSSSLLVVARGRWHA